MNAPYGLGAFLLIPLLPHILLSFIVFYILVLKRDVRLER